MPRRPRDTTQRHSREPGESVRDTSEDRWLDLIADIVVEELLTEEPE